MKNRKDPINLLNMTLVDVAELAGVSKATVSRVMNDQGNVLADTVERVRAAAASVGYRKIPGGPGRRLKNQGPPARMSTLNAHALVVPDVLGGLYLSLQEGLESGANERYQQVIVCNSQNDPYKQGDQILQLMQKQVSAVSIVTATSSPTPPHQVQMLQQVGIPVVLLHREVANVRAPLIELPIEQIGFEAGREMMARGHRRVALLSGFGADSTRVHLRGFQQAVAGADLQVWPLLSRPDLSLASITPEVQADVAASLQSLWELPAERRPTALFATFDSVAELVYMTLLGMGVRIPQDISLVSFGDKNRVGALTSRLSACVVDEAHAGRRAAALASEMRSGARALDSEYRELLTVGFSDGETLSNAKGS